MYITLCTAKVGSPQENMRLATGEIKENAIASWLFAVLWGLCKLLQGRLNIWLAYLLLSSVCWQPASPGNLAYRQQVKQIGNYSVIFSPHCCSIMDPFFRLLLVFSFFLKPLSSLYIPDLLLYTFRLSLLPGVCHVIIFQSHLRFYLEIWICLLHGKWNVGQWD